MTVNIIIAIIIAIATIWGVVEAVFKKRHNRPLTEAEIVSLMHKRQKKYVNRYFVFKETNSYPTKEFKSGLNASGRWYPANIDVRRFPSYVANLLKGKRHEWILLACVRNSTVEHIYANKGCSTSVSFNVDLEVVIDLCKRTGCQTIMCFHNHPNNNPVRYNCLGASDADKRSARDISSIVMSVGLNWFDFVCERGRFLEYGRYFSAVFYPEECSHDYIVRQNSNPANYNKLHRELGILNRTASSSVRRQNGIINPPARGARGSRAYRPLGAAEAVAMVAGVLIVFLMISLFSGLFSGSSKKDSSIYTTYAATSSSHTANDAASGHRQPQAGLMVITAKNYANIRKGPSSKTDIVTTAKRDKTFYSTGRTERAANGGLWYEIYLDDSHTTTAWASEQIIKVSGK